MTQDRLKNLLSEEKKPIQKGKPLGLSTEASTSPATDASAKTHHRTIAPTEQYKRVNRGYKLREDLIKDCKRLAIEQNKMLYEVMEEALTTYLEQHKSTAMNELLDHLDEGADSDPRIVYLKGNVLQPLQRRPDIEERVHKEQLDIEKQFRTNTEVHHFKKWLRSHDQPRGSDFFKRFLADGQLPEHASRGMYEAKMKVAGYSQEDIYLFQDAWKTMLFLHNI